MTEAEPGLSDAPFTIIWMSGFESRIPYLPATSVLDGRMVVVELTTAIPVPWARPSGDPA